ncbi:Major intracellular serine protease [Terrisporobacter petrolearius]|uniref:Major intracellular serine protease n=1 Tax=Terrisporobacter petrolearius TaxID=1460447 RepID=A0ABZ3FBT6_9FIRM
MENLENIILKQVPVINYKDVVQRVNISITSDKDYITDGVVMINAPFMWSKGITGKNVKIAVIDSGCDTTHKDLQNRIIGGRNFTTEDNGNINKYEDYNGHGTHVCGTIAASNNNKGVTGVAPDAKLLILKALDKNGSGSMKSIIDAINFAISEKVDIISMSLGTSKDIPQLHQVIKKAVDSDILVVCAAGNEGDGSGNTDEFSYPAGYNEVISVGAVDFSKSAARFSDSNKEVDLVAPGVNIVSTFLNGKYETLSGTSMATPHVTGSLALLIEWSKKEFGRKLSEAELYGQLIKNTNTLPILRTLQGNGLVFMDPKNILK